MTTQGGVTTQGHPYTVFHGQAGWPHREGQARGLPLRRISWPGPVSGLWSPVLWVLPLSSGCYPCPLGVTPVLWVLPQPRGITLALGVLPLPSGYYPCPRGITPGYCKVALPGRVFIGGGLGGQVRLPVSTTDYRLLITGYRYRIPITDYRLLIADY